ncbi:MAG: hypothetical protein AAGJ78_15565, partial [Pseudomonadota bacterium]
KLDTAGSAESGTDYEALEFFNTVSGQWEAVPADGTITIAASGEAVKVRAQVIDDLETEPTETVRLKASTESEHVSDRNASDVVRIEDDRGTRPDGRPGADEDAPNLIVTALEESVVEGGTEASPLYVNFEVALDGPAFAAVDVKLDTAGSAESGTDYEALEFFNTVSG